MLSEGKSTFDYSFTFGIIITLPMMANQKYLSVSITLLTHVSYLVIVAIKYV